MLINQVCDGYDVLDAYECVLHFAEYPSQQLIDDTVTSLVAGQAQQEADTQQAEAEKQAEQEILAVVKDIIVAEKLRDDLIIEVQVLTDTKQQYKDKLEAIGVIVDHVDTKVVVK